MIDIHCHILPGVDDGPQGIDEAFRMLHEAARIGVTAIITTPHYCRELHESGIVAEIFGLMRSEAAKYGITLLLGFEIKIHTYPARMPTDYSGLTLGGTRYILFELPRDRVPSHTQDLIYKMQLNKLIPILAHPERCAGLIKDKVLFADIVDSGCLLQVDASSILGHNGRAAKKFARKLIASGLAEFVASDAHNPRGFSDCFENAYKKVVKWVGCNIADNLFRNNAEKIFREAQAFRGVYSIQEETSIQEGNSIQKEAFIQEGNSIQEETSIQEVNSAHEETSVQKVT